MSTRELRGDNIEEAREVAPVQENQELWTRVYEIHLPTHYHTKVRVRIASEFFGDSDADRVSEFIDFDVSSIESVRIEVDAI